MEMIRLVRDLVEAKEKESIAKEHRVSIESEIYELIEGQLIDDSTLKIELEGFVLKVKPSLAVKVDQEAAAKYPGAFKIKYEMSYSQYKKTGGKVDDIVTISSNKPSFTVENKNDTN
jgi:hypothetical protein